MNKIAGATDLSESNIEKAVRFWNHPSLLEIPSDQKLLYLKERGVTQEEVHQAWERIAEQQHSVVDTTTSKNNTITNEAKGNAPLFANNNKNLAPLPPQPIPYGTHPQHHQQQYAHEDPLTIMQGASLVTLGGMIGLTAAAASRWLNGGDFQLFPPPKYPSTIGEQRNSFLRRLEEEATSNQNQEIEEDEDYSSEEYDTEGEEESFVEDDLAREVECIAETLKVHGQTQEKILQKLNAITNPSITDQSVNLLRSHQQQKQSNNDNKEQKGGEWTKELVEIKAGLKELVESLGGGVDEKDDIHVIKDAVNTTLGKLESCIQEINASFEEKDPEVETLDPLPNSFQTSEPQLPEQAETNTTPEEKTDVDDTPCSLRDAIRTLAEENEATDLRVGCQLLYLYIINLLGKPDNPRYRKIFTCNDSFQRLENLKGAKQLLMAVGFVPFDGYLEWMPRNDDNDYINKPEEESLSMERLREAASALGLLKSGKKSKELTEKALAAISLDEPNR